MSVLTRSVVLLSLLAALPAAAQSPQGTGSSAPGSMLAADPPRLFRFAARLGIDGGGDDLLDVPMSDGTTATISAGAGVSISGGVAYTPEAPYVLQALVGFKVDEVIGSNGKVQFARTPVDLLAYYQIDGHRLGGGVTYHIAPRVNCEVDGICSRQTRLDGAFGALLEYEWGYYHPYFCMELGLRATLINYEGLEGTRISGSTFGGFFGFGY